MNISGRETTFLQRDNVVTQCQGDTKENTLCVRDFLSVTLGVVCDDGVVSEPVVSDWRLYSIL